MPMRTVVKVEAMVAMVATMAAAEVAATAGVMQVATLVELVAALSAVQPVGLVAFRELLGAAAKALECMAVVEQMAVAVVGLAADTNPLRCYGACKSRGGNSLAPRRVSKICPSSPDTWTRTATFGPSTHI